MTSSHHPEKDLDCTNCSRGLWLVKVPKYIRETWAEAQHNADVGRLRITKNPGKPPTVNFSLNDSLNKERKLPMPIEHKFILHSVKEQTLGVFSQTVPNNDSVVPEAEKVFMEGQVIQKFECQPVVDSNYIRLKSEAAKKASVPERQAMRIDRPAKTYKPITAHKHIKEAEERKKSEGKKARDDRDKVQEMLFAAFEKHQYYNIKDLQKITKQPVAYLREILQEVCNHNLKNPHKNMWELKPEFRHYKEDNPTESSTS